ncbi:hypothetical protein Gotur_025503 [Gossypium turneri]
MATECKKRAVLVGCNYPNTINELSRYVNDVKAMREMIVSRFGFDSENVELLTDEPESTYKPTLDMDLCTALIPTSLPTRVKQLCLVISIPFLETRRGLGAIDSATTKWIKLHNDFGFLPQWCTLRGIAPPVDYKTRGISIETLYQCLQTAANIVSVTQSFLDTIAVANAINTGIDNMTGIGSLLTTIFGNNVSIKFLPHYERDILNLRSLTEDEGILLSGCQANELSIDMGASDKTGGKTLGAFTYTILKVIKESNGALTNRQLVVKARNEIINLGFGQ